MRTQPSLNALTVEQQRNLILLFITALFFWTSLTCLLPTLPLYIENMGATLQQVGIVMGGFAIGLLGFRTLMGQLADYRSRKLVILIGAMVATGAPIGYLSVDTILALLGIRAFHGISVAAFTTGFSALVVDLAPPSRRGEIIGYMSLAVPIGMAIGPAVGGFMQTSFGFTTLFTLSGVSGFISLILASQIVEEKRATYLKDVREQLKSSRRFWQLFKQQSLLIPSLILLLIGLLFGTLVTFLPLYIKNIQLEVNVGLFYSIAAIASFSSRFVVGKASDRYGRGIFITGSLICYGLSMILLASSRTPLQFFLAAFLEGMGGGVLLPLLIALISDRSYDNERGKVYAICIGGFDLGIAIAGPVIGGLNYAIGYRGMFFLGAYFSLMGFVLFLTLSNRKLAQSWQFALGKGKDGYAVSKIL